MELATRDYIINTVFRTNIVPLISECNTSCIFCSHKQNPEGIEVYRMPRMNMEDFREILSYLSPNRKIVIGESATRIVEGEPLLHPQFIEIISFIRNRYKDTPIQITTNGILLSERLIEELDSLGKIELNISVNGASPSVRSKILGLNKEDGIREKLLLLKGRLKFSGSCVLVPEVLEWEDVEDVIALLDECGAETVRLFLPGYTSKAGKDADYFAIHDRTCGFVDEVRKRYEIPVIVEPAFMKDLDCRVEGIIKGSPAYGSGLQIGDIIVRVNGKEARTRVDAFDMAFRLSNPFLTVRRDGEFLEIKLEKPRNSSPGFVVLYDMDPDFACRMKETVKRHKAESILIVTSELACGIIDSLLAKSSLDFQYKILTARNGFFGGTIKCAGLLTVGDITNAVENYLPSNLRPDLIVLPSIMFDFKGRDLTGTSMREVETKLGIPVDIS